MTGSRLVGAVAASCLENWNHRAYFIPLKIWIRPNTESGVSLDAIAICSFGKRAKLRRAHRKIVPESGLYIAEGHLPMRNEKRWKESGVSPSRFMHIESVTVWLIVESFVFPFSVVWTHGIPRCAGPTESIRKSAKKGRQNIINREKLMPKCVRRSYPPPSERAPMIVNGARVAPEILLFNCLFVFRNHFSFRSPMDGDVVQNLHLTWIFNWGIWNEATGVRFLIYRNGEDGLMGSTQPGLVRARPVFFLSISTHIGNWLRKIQRSHFTWNEIYFIPKKKHFMKPLNISVFLTKHRIDTTYREWDRNGETMLEKNSRSNCNRIHLSHWIRVK